MRPTALIVFALLAIVALPVSAMAADAEPDAISDPASAFADSAEATIDLDPASPEAAAAPERAPASTSGGGQATAAAVNVAPVATRQPTTGAQLPFTGVETDLAIALGLLGVLLVAGGIAFVALPSTTPTPSAR